MLFWLVVFGFALARLDCIFVMLLDVLVFSVPYFSTS